LSGEPIKSRLGSVLTRTERQEFFVASLADTLETAARFEPRPTLFLSGGEKPDAVAELHERLLRIGLPRPVWTALRLEPQRGEDLGRRLEAAIQTLADGSAQDDAGSGALVVGADSPTLRCEMLRDAARRLRDPSEPIDVVLGPTRDGGYWTIGVRRPHPGLLRGIAWSTPQALADTERRARELGLRVGLAAAWTDVDVPADLDTLAEQIRALRHEDDHDTARHVERFMRQHGWLNRS
jgi:2-phospho-L-lactate guanylyltransferase (CobY/MobA/RfbA family)